MTSERSDKMVKRTKVRSDRLKIKDKKEENLLFICVSAHMVLHVTIGPEALTTAKRARERL